MEKKVKNKLVNHLINDFRYPEENIRSEVIISQGRSRYKADFILYREGKPYIIIDEKLYGYKSEDLSLLKKKIEVSGAKFGIITDRLGERVYFYKIDSSFPGGIIKEIPTIPKFGQDLTNITDFQKNKLITVQNIEDIITTELWKFFDKRREYEEISLEVLTSVIKILAAKVYDEEHNNNSHFRANMNDDAETIKTNIEMLLLNLEKKISISPKLRISNDEVKNLVLSLQNYNLVKSGIKKNLLPKILSTLFKNFSNTFLIKGRIIRFDPKDELVIGDFLTKLLDIQENDLVLDPVCGMGNLLVNAVAAREVYGIEPTHVLAELAKLNLYLTGSNNVKIRHAYLLAFDPENDFDIKSGKFNKVITNPPSGKRSMITIPDHLEKDKQLWQQIKSGKRSITTIPGHSYHDMAFPSFMKSGKYYKDYELYCLEKSLNLVTKNGKIAILLPDKILFSKSYKNFREYIAKNYKIDAVISIDEVNKVPINPYVSIVLISNERIEDYLNQEIFFGRVQKNIDDEYWLEKELCQIAKQYKIFSSKNPPQKFSKNIIISKLYDDFRLDYQYYKSILDSVIDEKYEVQPLKYLAEIQIGTKISELDNGNKNEVFVIRGQNIKEYVIVPNYQNKIEIDLKLNYKHLINYEDIVMTRSGNPENIGIFLLEENRYLASDNIILIRPNKEKILAYYLLCYLISENGQKDLQTKTKGNTIRSISIQSLSELKIPLPAKHIQESIATKFKKYLTLMKSKIHLEEELLQTKESIDSAVNYLYKNGGDNDD